MLAKKERRIKGKAVKAATGLPHPVAMHIGKLLTSYRHADILEKYPQHAQEKPLCGDGCCGHELVISGPKGEYRR